MEKYKPKLVFRHCFHGDIYPCEIKQLKNPSKADYNIDVQIPIDYETREDAINCTAYLRFQKYEGHIVLCIYSSFKQGFNGDGKWVEQIQGEIIDIVEWRQWWKYKMIKSTCAFYESQDPLEDYEPCIEKWDDIFQVNLLPEDWGRNVQSLAYSIDIIQRLET